MPDRQSIERARLHSQYAAELPTVSAPASVNQMSERVLASWQRSQEYGVSLGDIEPVSIEMGENFNINGCSQRPCCAGAGPDHIANERRGDKVKYPTTAHIRRPSI